MSTNKHDEWFKNFVRNFPRAEVVENVISEISSSNKPENADYFFETRRFIGELKSLITSRMPSVQSIVDELRDQGELPIFYHKAPVSEVIKDHRQREKLNKRFLKELSENLQEDFRKANSQICQTKRAFNLDHAKGFILVTNYDLPEMTPRLAWNELNRLLTRKRGNTFAYEHIDFAIYLQDVEVREINKDYAELPTPIVLREDDQEIHVLIDRLLKAIADAKGYSFREAQGDVLHVLNSTTPHKRFAKAKTQLTRSDLWKNRYLEARTYRQLADDNLLRELARFLLEECLTLKDGKIGPNGAAPNRDYLGEKLEGLFTECELRFVDMRKLRKQMDHLLEHRLVSGPVAEFIMQR